jgi:hypothetical protein
MRLRRWSSRAFRKRYSPAAFRTCRNAGNSVRTAEGTTWKGTGSISCEVEFCIFYRFSLRTLRTKDVVTRYICMALPVKHTKLHSAGRYKDTRMMTWEVCGAKQWQSIPDTTPVCVRRVCENHETRHSGKILSRPRFEPGIP